MTPKLKSIAFIFTLIVLFKLLPTPVTAQIDSLRHLLEHCHDSAKCRISTELADELYYAGNLDESIRYYSQAAEIELKRKKTDPENVARAMANIGYCYYEKAQYPNAAETYQTALEYAVQATDSLLLSDIYVNLGNSWFYLGNYEKSVSFFSKALSVDQALGNQKFTGINLNNLGKVFEAWKQSEKAIDFYMQALAISKQMNDSNSMAIRLSNIGTSYMSLNQFDSALIYLKKAYEIDSIKRNTSKFAGRLDLIGLVYQRQGKYAKAEPLFAKALMFANHPNLITSKAIILSNYSKNAFYQENYAKAEELAKASLELSTKLNLANTKIGNYLVLFDIYKKTQNTKQALVYLEKYANLRDTIFSEQSQKALNEFQVLYETEKKDNEIKLLNQQRKIQEIELQSTRKQQWLYLALALAMLSVAIILLVLYRNKRKTGFLLQIKNEQLNILNNTKDRFISILAHDLKNPLSAFANITEALQQNYDDIEDQERKELVSRMHQSAKSTYLLLRNLLEWATVQKKSGAEKIETVNPGRIVGEVLQILDTQAQQKNVSLVNKTGGDIHVMADKSYLSVVFNNLITNAIKFSPSGSEIRIESQQKEGNIEFSVIDQGIGMSPADVEKLFRIDVDVRSIGSHQNKGTGMGLILCHEMVEKMGGKMRVESKQGSGSKFMFILPVKTETNN